jgi:hypothetical protein
MTTADLNGEFSTGSPSGDHALLFAHTRTERLADGLPLAIAASERFMGDSRNFERMEDWSPSRDDLERSFRRMWSENATVVWISYQAQRWLARLALETGGDKPDEVESLRLLRNALEHLDTALFDESGMASADPNKKSAWSLRELGGLSVQSWAAGGPLFALVDVDSLRRLSRELTDTLHALADTIAEDYFVQQEIDRRRGSKSASSTPALTVRSRSVRENWWNW